MRETQRYQDGDGYDKPAWVATTTSMDDGGGRGGGKLLRVDPTDGHQWCVGFPCGVTTAAQLRPKGAPVKATGKAGMHYSGTRSSMLGQVRTVPPERTFDESRRAEDSRRTNYVRGQSQARGDWLASIGDRAHQSRDHLRDTTYRLTEGRRTPVASPRAECHGPTERSQESLTRTYKAGREQPFMKTRDIRLGPTGMGGGGDRIKWGQ